MKVLVFTAMYPTPEKPAFGSFIRTQVECLKQHGLDVDVLVLDGKFRKLIYPLGIIKLRQRLAKGDIDLIHAHYSYVGMVARTQWKVPVVVTYHGSDMLGSRKTDGRLARSNMVTLPAGRALALMVDACVVQSREMANKIPGANVHIIPHEIDFETFHPTEKDEAREILGLDLGKKYVLFAAHPDNGVKNFPLARAAVDSLARDDPAVELLVVHKEPQDRLALFMSACDALVFPSLSEGSPNIVKQAMACNLPIVATDVGDVRDVIGSTGGCYVSERSVDAFAGHLRSILAAPRRTNGRADVAHFTCPVVGGQLMRLYEDVARGARSGRSRAMPELSSIKGSEGGE